MYVPTSDIGSHENTAGFALKLVEGAQSRWLGHLAVQRNGTEAEVAQKQRYSHGAIARGCEDDDRVAGVLVEQVHEVAVLVLGRNEDVVLRQRLHGRVSDPRNRNRASVGRKGGREAGTSIIGTVTRTYLVSTSTLTGLVSEARCSFLTLVVMVAENKNVLRCLGASDTILLMSSSNSELSRRSASSKTLIDRTNPHRNKRTSQLWFDCNQRG